MEDNSNDPVIALGRIMAKLYKYMSDEVINAVGKDQGEKIVRKAVWKFGKERGKNIRNKVLDNNLDLTLENMIKYYDMPLNNAWEAEVELKADMFKEVVSYCPFAQEWIESNSEELGYIYCEQDIALMKAYNENIDFNRNENIMDGTDKKCRFNIKLDLKTQQKGEK